MGALIANEIAGVILNLIVFLLIPFICWLIFQRKKTKFYKYIGLNRVRLQGSAVVLIIFVVVYFIIYRIDLTDLFVKIFMSEDAIAELTAVMGSEVSEYYGMGFAAVIPAFIGNVVSNGFCEEVTFRGFITGRLKTRMSL